MPSLPELEFDRFYTYAEVTGFVDALHRARPDLCRLGSLGPSRQGREVPLLTVTDHTTGSAEDRPAYLIHGNIHAGELAGTHGAIRTHRGVHQGEGAGEQVVEGGAGGDGAAVGQVGGPRSDPLVAEQAPVGVDAAPQLAAGRPLGSPDIEVRLINRHRGDIPL